LSAIFGPPCPNARRAIRLVAEIMPLALTRLSGTCAARPEANSLEEFGGDFCGGRAISRRIVRRNFHDLGEEARLSLGVLAHEVMDRALDRRHRGSSLVELQASKSSTRIPS
jgi:hypothetical protein